MCNLCNDSKFTQMYQYVTGLVVLAQHHIGVTLSSAYMAHVSNNYSAQRTLQGPTDGVFSGDPVTLY